MKFYVQKEKRIPKMKEFNTTPKYQHLRISNNPQDINSRNSSNEMSPSGRPENWLSGIFTPLHNLFSLTLVGTVFQGFADSVVYFYTFPYKQVTISNMDNYPWEEMVRFSMHFTTR